MRRPKHRKDHNNGKNGWVGGNPRYRRSKAKGAHVVGKEKTMRPLRRGGD